MRRNNKNNDNRIHILTPTERAFYQRIAVEGTQQIIDEMWKVIRNPKEEQGRTIAALHLALDGNVQIGEMLNTK